MNKGTSRLMPNWRLHEIAVGIMGLCAALQVQAQSNPIPGFSYHLSGLYSNEAQAAFQTAAGSVAPVLVPGRRIELLSSQIQVPADGRSVIHVTLRLYDERGQLQHGEVAVLLEANRGRIVASGTANTAVEAAMERDHTLPGTQVTVHDGVLSFDLVAPNEPGPAQVRVSVGGQQQTLGLNFIPDLRHMLAVGIVEGMINFSHQKGGLLPVNPSDGFEQEILTFQRSFDGGDAAYGMHAAFFLKGEVSGQTLLTAAYDSDKNANSTMFRDIDPNQLYPVYGDASIKGFDAQTAGRLYVRIDKNRCYALYGDLHSEDETNDALQLGRYNRSMTGLKGHWENERYSVTSFATRGSLHMVVDELPGRGISGPYNTSHSDGVQNSETVELVVRDRNAPSVILRTIPQVRFVDYDFEPLSGSIIFTAPVPSLDDQLNPVSIRISYEVQEGGANYWVAGVNATAKVTDRLILGGSYARDDNPLATYALSDVNAQLKLGEHTKVLAEVAHSENGAVDQYGSAASVALNGSATTALAGSGTAWRAELRHQDDKLQAHVYAQNLSANFVNPTNTSASAMQEAGGQAKLKLSDHLSLVAEITHSKDLQDAGERTGGKVAAVVAVNAKTTLELGLRHAEQSGAGATIAATAFPGTGTDAFNGGMTLLPNTIGGVNQSANLNAPYDMSTVEAKATYKPTPASSVFLQGEHSVDGDTGQAVALGGEYKLSEQARLYERTEHATGDAGAYGLAGTGSQTATVVGIDDHYMKDGSVFSEYRLRDGIDGASAEAAMGLRNGWKLADGLRMSTSVERIKVLVGPDTDEATALGLGLDYTASAVWKAAGRVEWRHDSTSQTWLSTLAMARKLNEDWTFLGRNYWFLQNYDDGDQNRQDRLQMGFAWRQTDTNRWNALSQYQYTDLYARASGVVNQDSKVQILSTDVTYHPGRALWYGMKVAGEYRSDVLSGEYSTYNGQMVQARIMWDITSRWDMGLIVSTLADTGFTNIRTGVGLEVGRIVQTNLWVSLGYNFMNLRNTDLATDYSNQGVYLKMRYKFDENIFNQGQAGLDQSVEPPKP